MATVQMKKDSEMYEQLVLRIMRRLPAYRVLELVDFARFLEKQVTQQEEDATTEDAWGRVLAKPAAKQLLREMAREAREDYQAGRTTEIQVTDQGELGPA